ncbi:uncharacterized protein LOC121738441 [Aricia agestis]|uniref:uncharacterized protein LOC121738441 n=1 Tax=Aricia agestis TaxID=91739 RepID=UPI001C201BB7|nr:uncharacterized protein LOC121738441 [Aricia agestis]
MSEDLWEFYLTRDIQIGMAYIKLESPVALCNTIQFSTSWSIAPGFCVAMRSEPDMKNVVLLWRIKYAIGNDGKDLEIIRTIVHPLFTRTSLAHNIGLFQHETWDTQEFISIMLPFSINARGDKNMIIGSRTTFEGQTEINYHRIKIVESTHCNEIMSFIENIRKYEFCATFLERHDTVIEHGALVTEDNKVTGIFSWGDKNGKALPFVILNISYYQTWIRQEQRSYSNLEINENLL